MNNYTAREVYIHILTELVKEESPTLYLEDYLYFYNKAISEYLKSRYELYAVNQQLSDDLRFWKKQHIHTGGLEVIIKNIGLDPGDAAPDTRYHYRHLLNCIISARITRPIGTCMQAPYSERDYKVTRMSSEIKAGIINNCYLEPTFYRPYFELLENKIIINIGDRDTSSVDISTIKIEYLKQPEEVVLTEEQITPPASGPDVDTSQVLEFTKDVSDEITKIALKLILERGMDPRLQTHIGVNQSITDVNTGLRGR